MVTETIMVTPHIRFVAADFFDGWRISSNFKRLFLDVVEETVGRPVEIDFYDISGWLRNGSIIKELGGASKAGISIATFAAIAATGHAFVASVLDRSNLPWAVFHRLDGAEHIVGADSIDYQYWWYGGGRFASSHLVR